MEDGRYGAGVTDFGFGQWDADPNSVTPAPYTVHERPDLAGRAKFGPDVEWIERPDYTFDVSRLGRFVEAIRRYYPGLDAARV